MVKKTLVQWAGKGHKYGFAFVTILNEIHN